MEKRMEQKREQTKSPAADGFIMPGEFEPHRGCILIWPERPGSWIYGAKAARAAFRDVIKAIAASEKVYVAVGAAGIRQSHVKGNRGAVAGKCGAFFGKDR